MKTKITILITIATYIIIATACVKTTPKGVAYCGQLPCPTSTGANIVSCLINGQPFISIGGKPQDGMLTACHSGNYISYSALGSTTNFNFKMCTKTNPIYMNIYIAESIIIKEYILDNRTINNSIAQYNEGPETDSIHKGVFKITTLSEKIIAGTFNFIVPYSKDSNIVITNGSFDLAK